MTVAYSIISRIQQTMSFFVHSLMAPEWIYVHHSAARPKSLHDKYLSSGWYHWVWHVVVVYAVRYEKNHKAKTLANRLNQLWSVRTILFDCQQQKSSFPDYINIIFQWLRTPGTFTCKWDIQLFVNQQSILALLMKLAITCSLSSLIGVEHPNELQLYCGDILMVRSA